MHYTTTVAMLCGRLSSRRSETLINVQKDSGNINTLSCIMAQPKRNNLHMHMIYIRICSWHEYASFHTSSIAQIWLGYYQHISENWVQIFVKNKVKINKVLSSSLIFCYIWLWQLKVKKYFKNIKCMKSSANIKLNWFPFT